MPGFHRSHRYARDMKAGLIFCWRWFWDGFAWRMTVAVAGALVLFALLTSMVRVASPRRPAAHIEAASVMVLRRDSPAARELLAWARQQSPFPDRWTPRPVGGVAAAMAEIDARLAEVSRYRPRLRVAPEKPEEAPPLPGLRLHFRERLPVVEAKEREQPAPASPLRVRIVTRAEGPLRERWGARSWNWTAERGAEWLGRKTTCLVGVDALGAVVFSLALGEPWNGLAEPLDGWMRNQALPADPESTGISWDLVTVRVEEAAGSGAVGSP